MRERQAPEREEHRSAMAEWLEFMTTALCELTLSHLNLDIGDVPRSERFYGDVLGLPVTRNGEALSIRWGGSIVTLAAGTPQHSVGFHFGFRVENDAAVDAWFERFRALEISVVELPVDKGAVYVGRILDPDGYPIEIYADRTANS